MPSPAIASVNQGICTESQISWSLCWVCLHQDALSWKVWKAKREPRAEHLVRAELLSAEIFISTRRCSNTIIDYFPKASAPSAPIHIKPAPQFKHLWELQWLQGKEVIGVAGNALFSMDGQLPHGQTEVDGGFMHRHILFKWPRPLDTLSALEGLQLECCRSLIWSVFKHKAFNWSLAHCTQAIGKHIQLAACELVIGKLQGHK